MKKILILLTTFIFCIVLVACSNQTTKMATLESENNNVKEVMRAKIIEITDNALLITTIEKDASNLLTLSADTPNVGTKTLTEGAIVDIGYDGNIQERYPGKITNPSYIKVVNQGDNIVGLYKQVFSDLYEKDKALNDSIEIVACDFSNVHNLTSGEKAALLYLLQNMTGVETRLATFEELEAENLIIERRFEKGLAFVLETSKINNHSFKFTAQKWRSGTGAFGYADCIATKDNNIWTYKIGHAMIS